MGETQPHDEQDRRTAPLFIPINPRALVGDVRHFLQSSRCVHGKWTTIYMVAAGERHQMEWVCDFTLPNEPCTMEAPPRISQRTGISVC